MKKVHMIGNAHLDPLWLWTWQEGYSEAKSTIRSALDRMKEFDDFIFTCAGASVYSWIEQCCPEMFEEVKQRVRQGRFVLAGGMWVQPDCNAPGGEGFARQLLLAQQFFFRAFGKTAKVGYNVDSFGHNAMLPQLLRKSGMDSYVFMRPQKQEKQLPSNLFYWQSPDGSGVKAFRIPIAYCNNFQSPEQMRAYMEQVEEQCGDLDEYMFFFGVGNHGGGPTVKNIQSVKAVAAQNDREICFSSPDAFFAGIDEATLPVVADELQFHAKGCYSALSAIKQQNRRCENRLLAAEKWSVLSTALTGAPYPAQPLRTAWENTAFCQFHDSLGGCSIKPAYDDIFAFGGEALSVAAKTANTAMQRLAWRMDTCFTAGGSGVVVYNPHSFPVNTTVRINNTALAYVQMGAGERVITDEQGNVYPVQNTVYPTKCTLDRPDGLFTAQLPAFGYRVYKLCEGHADGEAGLHGEPTLLENEYICARFTPDGILYSLKDRASGKEYFSAPAAAKIYEDAAFDTWAHDAVYFDRCVGEFTPVESRMVDAGPVRVSLRVTLRYEQSTLTQTYSLDAHSHMLQVQVQCDWQQPNKQLHLCFPTALTDTQSAAKIPFGYIKRPCDGKEYPCQEWTALVDTQGCFGVYNDSTYSFSAKENTLSLTVLRSPVYADHGGLPADTNPYRTPDCPVTDLGAHSFRYGLTVQSAPDFAGLTAQAKVFQEPMAYVLESAHDGSLPGSCSALQLDSDHVLLSSCKESEDGKSTILRLCETAGKQADTALDSDMLNLHTRLHLGPYEVLTLRVQPDGSYTPCLLTEFDAE